MSTLTDILTTLEADASVVAEDRSESKREKLEKVFELKIRGIPVSTIAKAVGVDVNTVYRYLKQYAEEYRQRIEQEPAANLISESLAWLDKIEGVCLFEAHQTSSEVSEIDPRTGEVTKKPINGKTKEKISWIQAAMKAREQKLKLMLDTGVLPREPDRLYNTLKKEAPSVESDRHAKRTREELLATVGELLHRTQQI